MRKNSLNSAEYSLQLLQTYGMVSASVAAVPIPNTTMSMKSPLILRNLIHPAATRFYLAAAAAATLLVGQYSKAATYDWNQTTGSKSWSLNTNWTPAAPLGGPSIAGDVVTINTNIAGTNTNVLYNTGDAGTAAKTIGILNIGDTNGTNFFIFNAGTGGGYLVMDNNGAGAEIHQLSTGAADTIGAGIQISDSAGLTLFNDNSAASLNINGGVTGTGDLNLKNNSATASGLKFATTAINNTGKIVNSGTGSGTVLISGASVGSNVTEIIQNSASSQLNISGGITVNSSGTTLKSTTNTGGVNLTVQLTAVISGTGDLILQNNGSLVDGIALTNIGVGGINNNTGKIINNGTGTGNSVITSIIGTNVTGVIQDSLTSGLTLAGVNTFTNDGATTFGLTIKRGVVTAKTSASALGAGAVTLGDSAGGSDAASLQAVTTTLTYANPFILASNTSGTLSIGGSAAATFSGGVTGTNNLTINVAAGSAINFSTAAINNAGTITNSGTGIGTATVATVGSNVTGIIENSTTSALTVTTLNLRGASLATTLTNALGTKVLTVTNVDTGAGNLVLNNNSSTANAIVLTNGANNTGSITNSGTGSGTQTIGVIGGNVTGVTQNSTTSSLTLNAANTYTGGTTISAGTLVLATAGTILNSSGVNLGTSGSQGTLDLTSKTSGFTLGTSQTLSGYGNVTMGSGKTLTVNGGLAPGNSPGVIAISGNLTLGATATTTMELINSSQAAGTGFDQISLGGTTPALTYDGTLTLNLTGGTTLGVYHLFTGFSSQSGTFSAINYSLVGAAGSFDYTTGDFTLTAVPEPSTWALLAFSLTTVMVMRRRRG